GEKMAADGRSQRGEHLVRVLVRRPAERLGIEPQLPVPPLNRASAFLDGQLRTGVELTYAGKDAPGSGDVPEREIVVQTREIERVAPSARGERCDLRRKRQRGAALCDVQRLDAQAIACEDQQATAAIPQREREHPVEVLHEVVAVFLVEVG